MVLTEISDTDSARLGQNIQPTFGYYRQSNGWITISPNTRLERLAYTEQGWEYLEEYGAFDMTAYTANHPFEELFMFGGAKEMSVDQVIETGLYIDPPLVPTCRQHLTQFHRAHNQTCWRRAKPVVFPQLADVPAERLGPFVCEFCKRKMPTQQARDQHQSVAHATPLNNVQLGRTLGSTLASVMGTAQAAPPRDNPENEVLRARIAELEAQQAKVEKQRANMAKARAARGKRAVVKS